VEFRGNFIGNFSHLPDGAGTLGNRTTLRFKGEFALTAIDNDLFLEALALWRSVGESGGNKLVTGNPVS
jgi:hypothetical protein